MEKISSNKKIAKNTIFLYFRMMFVMGVSLYTSRVNLQVLGIEDNGIYQVVGGFVTMLAFLKGSLAGATSRFITVDIGTNNLKGLEKTFSAAFEIHLFLSIIILILAETIGLWFFYNKLVIPINRVFAAQLVYQCSIFSCMLSIIQIPYTSLIIAYERMSLFAYLGILDVILKLGICYSLYVSPFDKLSTLGALMLGVSILNTFLYYYYCRKKFDIPFIPTADRSTIKPILSFSSWDLLGNFSVVARNQGVNIVLNIFFGPVINSAAGFANSIGTAVYSFSNNFMTAIRPPIVKAYSQADFASMQRLMINASKYSFSLMLILSLPFIFESDYIVKIWLKTPPPYTSIFAVLDLILNLSSTLFIPLVFVIHATGRIKFMSLVNGSIWFLSLPLTYILLCFGFSPTTPYIIKLVLLIFVIISNLYNVKKLIPTFEILVFIKQAVLPCALISLIAIPLTYIAHHAFTNEIIQFFSTCIISTCTILLGVFVLVLNSAQRNKILFRLKK